MEPAIVLLCNGSQQLQVIDRAGIDGACIADDAEWLITVADIFFNGILQQVGPDAV